MKAAALTLLLLLPGCATVRPPDGRLERRAPHITLLLCIFASCHIPSLNEQMSDLAGAREETPTPSPSAVASESASLQLASRPVCVARVEGIGPIL